MEKITLENCYGMYSISIDKDDMHIDEMFDDLIIPMLLAAGYQKGSIDRAMGIDE